MRYGLQLSVALMPLLFAACAQTGNLPKAPEYPVPVQGASLPKYYLQPGDTLSIKLMLNPELNEDVVVGPDGHISTAEVPDEIAAGRTVPELRAALLHDYSRDLTKPRLSVEVKSFATTEVYVAGEVGLPGVFAAPTSGPPLTLAEAIARAGGVKPTADVGRVFIIRRPVAGAQPQLLATDYDKVTKAIDARADVTLAPFDLVYVPKSGIAEVDAIWDQYVNQIIHPSFGFSYLLNNGGNNVVTPGATTAAPATTSTGTR
jgi:polysaccharide export outer membrane protein